MKLSKTTSTDLLHWEGKSSIILIIIKYWDFLIATHKKNSNVHCRQKGANAQTRSKSKAVSEKLRERLDKLMIKRRKEDVFLDNQIPEKNEQVLFCDLSPLQKEVYMHVLQLPDFELVKYGSRPCDCGINQEVFREIRKLSCQAERLEYFRTNKNQIIKQSKCCKKLPLNPRYNPKENNGEPYIDQDATIWRALEGHNSSDDAAIGGCEHCPWCCTFPCMKKLQLLSNHLGLLQCKKTKEAQIKGSPAYVRYLKEKEFAKVSLAGVVSRLPGNSYEFHQGITADHFCLSGKLEKLADLLENYDNASDKVLLFSHSTKTLDLIESFLRSRGTFIYLRMDGSTPTKKRQAIADEFNDNQHIFLFLLSTKAMGQGLNLTVSIDIHFRLSEDDQLGNFLINSTVFVLAHFVIIIVGKQGYYVRCRLESELGNTSSR